jgi:hypothetical protein
MIKKAFIEALNNTEIDERVRRLVYVLNDLPGVSTRSSCGGHENPSGSQVESDSFYVNFSIQMDGNRPSKKGWRSLGIIERATELCSINCEQEYDSKDYPYSIIVCNLTDAQDEESLTYLDFEISGRYGADPDMLADNISDIVNSL